MLEDLVGDDAPEIAGAGDEDPLEADAGAPAALERLADELARRVGEGDVQDEEEQPDPLRDFVEPDVLDGFRGVVGLVVERAAEAEDDGEDRPDEDPEEVVDARAPAPQPVEALDLEGDRHEQPDERRDAQVLAEGGHPFVHRQQAVEDFEAEQVGDEERRQAEQRVADDEEGDEQPVVPPHHDATSRFTRSRNCCWKRALGEGLGVAADGGAVEGARRHVAQGRGERRDGAVLDEHAGHAVHHAFDRSSFCQRDDRPAARLRLHRHHAEVLDPGHQDGRQRW